MAYCPECGEEVRSGASFCESCGSSLKGNQPETDDSDDTEIPSPTEDGFNWRHAGAAIGFGLIPAFGAYMLVSLAAYDPIPAVFFISIPIFGYLIYRRTTKKDMASGLFFWLAIEAFLMPVAAIIYTASYAEAETATAAGEAGAAIGGGILTILAFVIGLPLGIVFYIISGRLEPEK